jgi:hypothetical protein
MGRMLRTIAAGIVLATVACASSATRPHAAAERELSAMAVQFLVGYFGDSAVPPDATLVDFCDTCQGKADERSDVRKNRQLLTILHAYAQVTQVDVFESTGEADVFATCAFHDRLRSSGKTGWTRGVCHLTGVYRDGRWWLCDSTMDGHRTCDDGTNDCNEPQP